MSERYPIPALVALAAVLSVTARADVITEHQPAVKVILAAPPLARPFSLHDVRILAGPYKQGQDLAAEYLLSLDPDRLLSKFRSEAGLEPKADNYGGWEARGVAGHSAGHYLSGLALAWASTGDQRFLRRANYVVDQLAECQRANGNGYVAAIPEGKRIYAEVAAGQIRSAGFDLNGGWVPNYTMHKVFAGLRDAYRLCNNRKALEVECRLADWMESIHANLNEDQMQTILACEHGGLNETFADLYADTGDERYLALSRRFHHKVILDPLARGEDILPGKHANTQIPKITGLATRYELAGTESDRAAAEFFWEQVVNHHSYVTGGHCDHEHFGPPDRLNDRLSPFTTETCNVYNMFRLTRHVFGWNPDVRVADFYERAFLNHMRATQHPDGRVIYNLALQPGHFKEYQSKYDGFTCCVGTGMENHVRYGDAIYFHDDAGLWVNLFLPSELQWKARGITLRQETGWPESETSTLRVSTREPQSFELRIRRPYWTRNGFSIAVNGEPVPPQLSDSGYVLLRRTWKTGDRVDLRLPMDLHTESMPDNPNRIAIFYGPTLLAANLGSVEDPAATQADYVPALLTEQRSVRDWVKPVDRASLHFRTEGVGQPRDVDLVPFHRLHDRRYTVYLDVFSRAEWEQREASIRAQQERERALAERTLDVLRIGEMQPERDHDLRGNRTDAGEFSGRKWRHATDGGWFSFTMKVDPSGPNQLLCTYWGGDAGNRTFDILVNGTRIATETLESNRPGEFYDQPYSIPAPVTRGQESVTVRFQAQPGKWAGGLYGCRTLKPQP